jgi:hypothetical protein
MKNGFQEGARSLPGAILPEYGTKYDVDWVLMGAQGYQESQLNQQAKGPVERHRRDAGHARDRQDMNVGYIHETEANIHAGIKYMLWMIDNYYEKEPMTNLDKALFAFASYNAGAGKISQLRKEAAKRGLDPNVWFQNVEFVVAEKIGQETVTYVSNIYKYYIAYRLIQESRASRKEAVDKVKRANDEHTDGGYSMNDKPVDDCAHRCSRDERQQIVPRQGRRGEAESDEAACCSWAVKESGFDPAKPPPAPAAAAPRRRRAARPRRGRSRRAQCGRARLSAGRGSNAAAGAFAARSQSRRQNGGPQQAQQQQAVERSSRRFGRARAACLEGKGYTVSSESGYFKYSFTAASSSSVPCRCAFDRAKPVQHQDLLDVLYSRGWQSGRPSPAVTQLDVVPIVLGLVSGPGCRNPSRLRGC